MTSEGSRKVSFEISKTTVVVGLILLALGYFIGNTIPIGNNFQPNSQATVVNTVGSADKTSKISGTVNFDIPSFAKFQGSESAKINLVEFGDYQCPFCEKFFQYTEPQLKKDYIDSDKTKFYFLDFVIVGQDSLTLTQGAWVLTSRASTMNIMTMFILIRGRKTADGEHLTKSKLLPKTLDLMSKSLAIVLIAKNTIQEHNS